LLISSDFFFAALNLILVVWAVYETYIQKIGFDIFKTFVLSKLWSMAEWFVWATPWFSYRYPIDRKFFYKKLESQSPQRPQRRDGDIAMSPMAAHQSNQTKK
jgi:hypothetical protein